MFWQSAKSKRIKQLEFERDTLRFDVEKLKAVNSELRKALSVVTAREAETLRVARQGLSNIGASLDTGSRNRQTDSRLISDSSCSTPHDNFVYGSVAGSSPDAFTAGGGGFGGGGASETWEASCPSPDTSSSSCSGSD